MREYARNDISPYHNDDMVSNCVYSESNSLKITQQTAQYAIDTANNKLKALIEAGNEESKAYAEEGFRYITERIKNSRNIA